MDAFRAWVDARADTEPALAIQKDSVEEVALASAVHASD